jgi:DNA gyrase subunit A
MEVGLVQRVDIEEKMRSAYLSYAMSVITSRALPDVRDGLKPVQRRILYAIHDMGISHDRPTRKSARIVGEVLGKYHPHGDSAVYDAMVRMAQDFSMRYPLVDGQGNFGSVDGDTAAAMRYTEARLTAIGEELLLDIDKNTVDMVDNFDGSLQEPEVLPAKLPNLLVNGVGGIAVGMATNIPPHNLGEIVDALVQLIDHYDQMDDVSVDDLMRHVHGPDFPTGGTILGQDGIRQAYATGKGRIITRAQVHLEELRGYTALIVTELPYQVNKSTLVERIATLVRDERVQGIADLRDESDRSGMRIVIALKRNQAPEPVLADLYKYTQMQNTFGVNMLALVDGEPRLLSLKRVLMYYIEHRYNVLVRRIEYELERARARAHVLEGLLLAMDNLDAVIDTIRRSQSADTARNNLMRTFKMSEIQAQAVLDMQLRRLAALERKRIQEEYDEITQRIAYLEDLLASKAGILGLIKADLLQLKKSFGDPRRTVILQLDEKGEPCINGLLPEEDLFILVTRSGAVRRMPASASESGMATGQRDPWLAAFQARSRERVMLFTDRGRVLALAAHQLPDAAQHPEGLPALALAGRGPAPDDERVIDVIHALSCESDDGDGAVAQDRYITMATQQGKVKRVSLSEIETSTRGSAADPMPVIGLTDGDALVRALLTHGGGELMLVTAQGKAIRFTEDEVSIQGRGATGVKGIQLQEDDAVVDMDLVRQGAELVVLTALGYAKRTPLSEYSAQGRGGQGALTVDSAKLADTGSVTAARIVARGEEVIFCTEQGTMVRAALGDIPARDRTTWGRVVTRSRRGAMIAVAEKDMAVGIAQLGGADDGSGGDGQTPPSGGTRRSTRRTTRSSAPSKPRTSRATAPNDGEAGSESDASEQQPKPAPKRRTSGTRTSRSRSAAKPKEAPAQPTEGTTAESADQQETQPRSRRGRTASQRGSTDAAESRETTARTRRTTRSEPARKPPSRSRQSGSGSRSRSRSTEGDEQ